MISIETADVQLKLTSAPYDLNLPTIGLFIADSGLVDLDVPRLSTNIDREAFKITLADPSFELRELCNTGLLGAKVLVRIGFMNTTGSPLVGAATGNTFSVGAPVLDIGDLVVAYSGIVDVPAYEINTDGDTLLVIECSSPMAALDLVNPFYTSKDSLDQRVFVELNDQTDTAFDNVYAGSQSMSVAWGKK